MSSPLKEGEKEDRNQRCGKDHNNYRCHKDKKTIILMKKQSFD